MYFLEPKIFLGLKSESIPFEPEVGPFEPEICPFYNKICQFETIVEPFEPEVGPSQNEVCQLETPVGPFESEVQWNFAPRDPAGRESACKGKYFKSHKAFSYLFLYWL